MSNDLSHKHLQQEEKSVMIFEAWERKNLKSNNDTNQAEEQDLGSHAIAIRIPDVVS
jgi:hypothetical protein